jgi:hypothetical protein
MFIEEPVEARRFMDNLLETRDQLCDAERLGEHRETVAARFLVRVALVREANKRARDVAAKTKLRK